MEEAQNAKIYTSTHLNLLFTIPFFGRFWAVQRPLGSLFGVPWYEMSYVNDLRRFGNFLYSSKTCFMHGPKIEHQSLLSQPSPV